MVEASVRDRPPEAAPAADEDGPADLALRQMDEEKKKEMSRKMRRLEVLNDLPDQLRNSSSSSQAGSSMSTPESKGLTMSSASASEAAIRQKVSRDKRRLEEYPEEFADLLEEECDPQSMEEEQEDDDPSQLTLREKKEFFQQAIDSKQGKPSKIAEAKLRGKLEKSVKKMRNIRQPIQKGKAMTKRHSREHRHESQGSNIMVMYAEEDEFESAWRRACDDQKQHEAFWTSHGLMKSMPWS